MSARQTRFEGHGDVGVDTNVLLHVFSGRQVRPSAATAAIIVARRRRRCFVNPIVLVEFAWTLARTYKVARTMIAVELQIILEAPEFVIAHDERLKRALMYPRRPADFADYFLAEINRSAGCAATCDLRRRTP